MKRIYVLFTFVMLCGTGCLPTTNITVDFDDLSTLTAVTSLNPTPHPVHPGDEFKCGDIITETTSGTEIILLPFQWPAHAPNPPEWTTDGYVEIASTNHAGGSGNELHFNNASLGVVMPVQKTLERVTIKFADLGGNINLVENGDLHNEDNFASIASPTVKGLKIKITPAGSTTGTMKLSGNMTTFKFPGPIPPALEDQDISYSAVIGGGRNFGLMT